MLKIENTFDIPSNTHSNAPLSIRLSIILMAIDMHMTAIQRVVRGMDKIRKILSSTDNKHSISNNYRASNFWSFWSLNHNSDTNNDNNGQNVKRDGKASFWNFLFGVDDDDTSSLDPDLFRLLSEEDEGRESDTELENGSVDERYEDDSVDDDDDDDDDDESESGNESEDEEAESAPVRRGSKVGITRSTFTRHHRNPSHPKPSCFSSLSLD